MYINNSIYITFNNIENIFTDKNKINKLVKHKYIYK